MAKKTTRRSISVSAETYSRLHRLASLDVAGQSCSAVATRAIDALCTIHGVPPVPREEALAKTEETRRRTRIRNIEIGSQTFTF